MNTSKEPGPEIIRDLKGYHVISVQSLHTLEGEPIGSLSIRLTPAIGYVVTMVLFGKGVAVISSGDIRGAFTKAGKMAGLGVTGGLDAIAANMSGVKIERQ